MPLLSDLQGKVIIVTGAASGIGAATVRLLLEADAKVLGCDINDPADGPSYPEASFLFVKTDLTQDGACQQIVDSCLEKFGPVIDGLCNVAGVMDTGHSADTVTKTMWDRTMAINLEAPVFLMQAVLPVMIKQRKGSIANVSSKAGLSGAVAGVAYTASKHGLIGATKNVAWRFATEGIRCNAICPGAVRTNIQASIDRTKFDTAAAARHGLVYMAHGLGGTSDTSMATADEQAQVLVFLMSDASSNISGVALPVDGAWSTI